MTDLDVTTPGFTVTESGYDTSAVGGPKALLDVDPAHKWALREAAESVIEAWALARQVVVEAITTGEGERAWARTVVAARLAEVDARVQAERASARASADAVLAAAGVEAAALCADAETATTDRKAAATSMLAEAAQAATQVESSAEQDLQAHWDALERELERRQEAANADLEASICAAERNEHEVMGILSSAEQSCESAMAIARSQAAGLVEEVSGRIARREADADAALAELAATMAAMSDEVNAARGAARDGSGSASASSAHSPAADPAPARPRASRTAKGTGSRVANTRTVQPASVARSVTPVARGPEAVPVLPATTSAHYF